jgi:YbbR domain-containing protein
MNNVRQNTDKNVPSKKKKNRFSNNTFVFVFSLIIAVVIWFVMAANNTLDRPRVIYDIPITIQTSNSAQEEGVKIFNMTNATVNVAVSGSSLVINKITTDDIKVVANFAPDTTKLLGNTMLTSTLTLETQKTNSNVTDFTIESVSPTQVTVTYDKYKEATFDIEDNIQYSTATNYYASTPSISQSTVTVSGPESSVNKISRASVDYKISDQIDSTKNFTAAITLYDSDEKVINPDTSYLTLSTNSVDCTINVLSKQTVKTGR